jgi:non-specific serine/threonine protein kinase
LRELMGLVNKSLLHRAPTGRYEIHELLRQYAVEKLLESSETEAVYRRHANFFLALAEQSWDEILGPRGADWLHNLTAEKDNFRAALEWCLASGHVQIGLRMAGTLGLYWDFSSSVSEGRIWLTRLLIAAPEATLDRAWGLSSLGLLALRQGDFALAANVGEESLALSETFGEQLAIARSSFYLALPLLSLGDSARSRNLFERSRVLYEESNKPYWVTTVISCLGELARAEGNLSIAKDLDEQTVARCRRLDDKVALSFALVNLGMVLIRLGELDRSQELLQERFALQMELGGGVWLFLDLMALGFLANAKGQPVRAIRLLAASDALRETGGFVLDGGDRPDFESNLDSLRLQLDPALFAAAWAEGKALTIEQAVELARNTRP